MVTSLTCVKYIQEKHRKRKFLLNLLKQVKKKKQKFSVSLMLQILPICRLGKTPFFFSSKGITVQDINSSF